MLFFLAICPLIILASQDLHGRTEKRRPFELLELKEGTYETEYNRLAEDGTLTDEKGQFSADIGTIAVPENRGDSNTRMIELPIIRIRSTGDRPAKPIFWLAGGPGQSNMSTFNYDYFISRHDHVMVGYRGVDGSVSLDCPEISNVLKKVKDVLTNEAIEKVADAYRACAGRLNREGIDINGFTPLDVVEDIEAVREALGYEKINILAESYGTRPAYLYGLKYPDRVRRTVMIGANPPGRMVWDPRQTDELLKQYGELWAKDPNAGGTCGDLVAAIREVNRDMPRRWLFFPIYPGNIQAAAFAGLANDRANAATVLDTYCAAANGDASGLWLVSFVGHYIFPNIANWGDNASKAVSADFDSTRDYANEMVPEDAILGAPLGRFLWAPAQLFHWPIQLMPEKYRQSQHSDVETLILSGSLDFSTPAENATNDLLPYLSNGKQFIMAEFGHVGDIWNLQPQTTQRILTSFFETGEPDTSLYHYEPMDFQVTWGFPLLAKLLLGGALFLIALVGVSVWLTLRFTKRRLATKKSAV
ncbi:MAG: alpha/beta fold hydrolase [bacterium]